MKALWKKLPNLILASASPRRQELLRELDVPFSVLPGSATEALSKHLTPRELCLLNAYAKAHVVAERPPIWPKRGGRCCGSRAGPTRWSPGFVCSICEDTGSGSSPNSQTLRSARCQPPKSVSTSLWSARSTKPELTLSRSMENES